MAYLGISNLKAIFIGTSPSQRDGNVRFVFEVSGEDARVDAGVSLIIQFGKGVDGTEDGGIGGAIRKSLKDKLLQKSLDNSFQGWFSQNILYCEQSPK
jgi:hypothetical protein